MRCAWGRNPGCRWRPPPRPRSGNRSASAKATADRTADERGRPKGQVGRIFDLTGLVSHSKLCTVWGGGRRPGSFGGRRVAVRLVFDIGAEGGQAGVWALGSRLRAEMAHGSACAWRRRDKPARSSIKWRREGPEMVTGIAPMNRGGGTLIRHGCLPFPLPPALSLRGEEESSADFREMRRFQPSDDPRFLDGEKPPWSARGGRAPLAVLDSGRNPS